MYRPRTSESMAEGLVIEMADRPRVLSVSYIVSNYADYTEARVMTPLGEQNIRVKGFWASKDAYPKLIEGGLGLAWVKFCNVA